MYIWDLATFTSLCVVMNAHSDGITTCCWSDVGTYVVTGSNDFKLKLWNTTMLLKNKDEPSLLKERSTFLGHTTTINDVKYKVGIFFCFCSVSFFSSSCFSETKAPTTINEVKYETSMLKL